MSEIPWTLWKFTGIGLAPNSALDLKLIEDRYARGTVLRAKFAQDRSAPHHRLYWAVLAEIVDATGQWNTPEDLHEAIKLHLRMVRGVNMLGDLGTRFITKSINFNSMDQGEFNGFFERAMLAIREATGIDTDEVIKAVHKKYGLGKAA